MAESNCSLCEAGTYQTGQEINSSSFCIACYPGSFSTAAGQGNESSCYVCPSGKFGNSSGLSVCFDCPVGTYSSVVGSANVSSCIPCPAHTMSLSGSTGVDDCSILPGYLSTGFAVVFRLSAPYTVNQFLSSNLDIQIQSAFGQFLGVSPSRVNINLADVYTLRRRLLSIIIPVTITGYATADAASAAANLINQLALANRSGALANLTLVSPAVVTILVQSCPAGQFAGLQDSQSCNNCSAGSYSVTPGASTCILCPAGQFSTGAAETVCKTCSAGKYQTAVGASLGENCILCLPGTYQSGQGMSNCTACAAGKFSSGMGIITAENCSAVLQATNATTSDQSLLVPLLSTFLVLTALAAALGLFMWRRGRLLAKKKTSRLETDIEAQQDKQPTATLTMASKTAEVRPTREAGDAVTVPTAVRAVDKSGEDSAGDKNTRRPRKDRTSASKIGKRSGPATSFSIESNPVAPIDPEVTTEAYSSVSRTMAKSAAAPADTKLETGTADISDRSASRRRRKERGRASGQEELSTAEAVVLDAKSPGAGGQDAAQTDASGLTAKRSALRRNIIPSSSPAAKSVYPLIDSPIDASETAGVSLQRNPDPMPGEKKPARRQAIQRRRSAEQQTSGSPTRSGTKEAEAKARAQPSATASLVLVPAPPDSPTNMANAASPADAGDDTSQNAASRRLRDSGEGKAKDRAVSPAVKTPNRWRRREKAPETGQQSGQQDDFKGQDGGSSNAGGGERMKNTASEGAGLASDGEQPTQGKAGAVVGQERLRSGNAKKVARGLGSGGSRGRALAVESGLDTGAVAALDVAEDTLTDQKALGITRAKGL